MKRIVINVITVILSFLVIFGISSRNAAGQESKVSREEWEADDNILAFEEAYTYPRDIVLVVFDITESVTPDSEALVQDLYYYFATRSGLGDFPFHSIITWDGKAYSGNKLGYEAKISLGEYSDSVFIAYVPGESGNVGPASIGTVGEVLLSDMNKYGIPPQKVVIKEFSYEVGEKGEMENISLTEVSKQMSNSFSGILDSVSEEYKPSKKEYKVEVTEVLAPKEEAKIGETAEVVIEIKNVGDTNIYDSSNLYFSLKEGEKSAFYLADAWDSPTQIAILGDGERLAVGQEKEINIKVSVPLYFPQKSEKFQILDSDGNIIKGTEFTIELKISKGDKTVVEVVETSVGYLNVRETPGLGDIITKVSPGERFIVLETMDGYYKISANGKEGWVVSRYVKEI